MKLRDMSIRTKLVGFTLLLVLVPLGIVSALAIRRFDAALKKAAEEDLEHLVSSIYSMCELHEEMVQGELEKHLEVARFLLLKDGGSIRVDERETKVIRAWKAGGDDASWEVDIPRWFSDTGPIELDDESVDRVGKITGGTVSVFVAVKGGTLLRIATNLTDSHGRRAVGMAVDEKSEVYKAIFHGRPFRGRVSIFGQHYIEVCEPLLDLEGSIIGALGVGIREPIESIKRQVRLIRVGRTGYAYIMDSNGVLKVHPAKEGESIIDVQDSQGFPYIRVMVEKAKTMSAGEVATIRYPWMNPELGEKAPRQKITKYTYFPPWDWIIAAGTYEEEIYSALEETERFIGAVALFSLPLVIALAVGLSRVLTRRIGELTQATARMLDGDLSQRVQVKGKDEVGILALSFNRMASQIQQYTTDLQRMVDERTRELAQSRERYRELFAFLNSILESATHYAIIALDFKGQIMEFNRGAERLFGWSKEEVVGKRNISITIPKEILEAGIQRQIVERTRVEGICELELDRIRKDGSRFPAHSVVTAMIDSQGRVSGFVEVVGDLTRRKLLEKELRETKEFLENIMASSIDGIVTTNLKGHITFLNRGMEEMLGYFKEELLGRHISELYARGIQEAREIMAILYERERVQNYEMQIKRKDGELLTIMTSASLLKDSEGKLIGTVGIFKDVTEQKKLEAKLKETQAHLVETSKLRALGELVAGVAHELNNPLMASQTMLHVLERGLKENGETKAKIDVIKKCNERIARIVDHLREFSRQTRPELKPLNINVPIENALLITGQQLMDHQIQLTKSLASRLPPIKGDANQLEQVFLNLISNARDALDETQGKKELVIETCLQERRGRLWVVAKVKDTGPGIPPEIMDKVMEPFFTTKPVGRGTGLGLSLCFKIVEDHGGVLELKSELGRGTEVWVLFPASVEH